MHRELGAPPPNRPWITRYQAISGVVYIGSCENDAADAMPRAVGRYLLLLLERFALFLGIVRMAILTLRSGNSAFNPAF